MQALLHLRSEIIELLFDLHMFVVKYVNYGSNTSCRWQRLYVAVVPYLLQMRE